MTSSMFKPLDVKPFIGRVFTPEEERYSGPHAVVLSEPFWRSALGGDPEILRRSLQLNGEEYRIVGVMPPSFRFPNEVTEMWTPVAFQPKELASRATAGYYLRMVGRLANGLSLEQGTMQLGQLSRQMALQHDGSPRERAGWQFFLLPMAQDNDGSVRRWMTMLFAAVTGLLMVVCSNVAGLILVRCAERQFDYSLRMALGASRIRIARQALTEVLLLACGGGIAGLLIAKAGLSALANYSPVGRVEIESPVFWFSAGLALASGIAAGLYPAWAATRTAPIESLKEGGHQRTLSAGKQRWQQGLIVAQVAMATTILLSGGLLLRSFLRLLNTPPGFNPRGVLTMQIDLPPQRYLSRESRASFFDEVVQRTSQIAGVESVSACTLLPFGYGENLSPFEVVGRPKPQVSSYADANFVSAGYLKTLEIPLLRGRFFNGDEDLGSQLVAVIDETLSKRYFAGANPIGQYLKTPWATYRIVGVVGNVKVASLDVDGPPAIYFSARQESSPSTTLAIRSKLPVSVLTNDVQRIVTQLDKDQPIHEVSLLETYVNRSLKTRRFVVFLVMLFGVAGAMLSALGLYGLLSYSITSRRREIGIRMAIGASGQSIAALIYRGGISLVVGGVAMGCVGAVAVQRVIASQLYSVGFGDSVTWAAVLVGVTLVGMLACALPAWHAARTNPLDSLRQQ
jgi:putative ABC transport system permease protein